MKQHPWRRPPEARSALSRLMIGTVLGTLAVSVAGCRSDSNASPPNPSAAVPASDPATAGTEPEPASSDSIGPSPTEPVESISPTEPEPAIATDPAVSIGSPEIVSTSVTRLLDQSERSRLGGSDTYYWPDGNIGALELGDGTTRFFAANSGRIARTLGTPLDPAATIETSSQEIEGVSAEFAYVAGGPVYLDPDSGVLLLWYHAERHLAGDAANFHAAIGLARSDDLGGTFTDLGIIIETNSAPNAAAPCCADVGGAPVVVRDGMFHLWFRDRIGETNLIDVQLARASAPVDAVVAAALEGELAPWSKYDDDAETPGLGGTSSPLESGNPRTSWFDVAWHDGLQRYLMVIAVHGVLSDPSTLYLTSSTDGIEWTPRQVLVECDCELTYPSFLGTSGPDRVVGDQLDIVYVATAPTAAFRWEDTSVESLTVSLSGGLITSPTDWQFDGPSHDWRAGGDARATTVDGALIITADGNDPFITRAGLGLSTADFGTLTITMSTDVAGVGQVFFTTDEQPDIDEARSVRFAVDEVGSTLTYELDLADIDGWDGLIDTLRIDPVDQVATMTIESIQLTP